MNNSKENRLWFGRFRVVYKDIYIYNIHIYISTIQSSDFFCFFAGYLFSNHCTTDNESVYVSRCFRPAPLKAPPRKKAKEGFLVLGFQI